MKRMIVAAVLGLFLAAGSALAEGFCTGPGCVRASGGVSIQWGYPNSGVLGPWYLYWPYEAHFVTPAHPQFPYWPSNQVLPGGAPVAVQPSANAAPSYWH
jgi:hypothetical protein